jgi:hypothetical protein
LVDRAPRAGGGRSASDVDHALCALVRAAISQIACFAAKLMQGYDADEEKRSFVNL